MDSPCKIVARGWDRMNWILMELDSPAIILAVYMFIFGLGTISEFLCCFAQLLMCTSHSHRTSWYIIYDPASRHAFPLTHPAEFQIPPQVSRYASFMFSFVGRGACKRRLL